MPPLLMLLYHIVHAFAMLFLSAQVFLPFVHPGVTPSFVAYFVTCMTKEIVVFRSNIVYNEMGYFKRKEEKG